MEIQTRLVTKSHSLNKAKSQLLALGTEVYSETQLVNFSVWYFALIVQIWSLAGTLFVTTDCLTSGCGVRAKWFSQQGYPTLHFLPTLWGLLQHRHKHAPAVTLLHSSHGEARRLDSGIWLDFKSQSPRILITGLGQQGEALAAFGWRRSIRHSTTYWATMPADSIALFNHLLQNLQWNRRDQYRIYHILL